MPLPLWRFLFGAAKIVVAVALVTTVVWALATMGARPLDGVEGDVFFEADRLRSGRALYIDVSAGALDDGPPPARYLVLYPPLWSAVLALVPRDAAFLVGRLCASLAWFGGIGLVVWRAPKQRRAIVAALGAFVAGTWVLALYGANARPDAVAVFAAGLALERSSRLSAASTPSSRPSIDAVSGFLFAVAAWIKPNMVGMAPGALLGCVLATRGTPRAKVGSILPGLGAIVGTSALIASALHVASGGQWLEHLLASTGQPPNGALWLGQIAARGPFFALPLLATLMLGARASRDPGAAIATGALVTSTLWAAACLAKIGSASNYFMEPCVAMLIVASRVDLPRLSPRGKLVAASLALAQVSWTATASIGGAVRDLPRAFAKAKALADVRELCGASPNDLVLADEPGLELMLNGRVVATPFQSTHLARRGRFPVDAWLRDVASPQVGCLVMQDDLLERPMSDERVAHDRFGPELRRALEGRFELATTRAGYWIYRVRPPASSAR